MAKGLEALAGLMLRPGKKLECRRFFIPRPSDDGWSCAKTVVERLAKGEDPSMPRLFLLALFSSCSAMASSIDRAGDAAWKRKVRGNEGGP
jgi:hypothetical protein